MLRELRGGGLIRLGTVLQTIRRWSVGSRARSQEELQRKLGYTFSNTALLEQALKTPVLCLRHSGRQHCF